MQDRTGQLTTLMHKIAFLANEFPDKKFKEISDMITVPVLDFNISLAMAQDSNMFTVDPETDKVTIDQLPKKWLFDNDVQRLQDATLNTMKKWAEKESDIHEEYFIQYTTGYDPSDIIVAMKDLLAQGVVVEYNIENVTKATKKGEKDSIDNYVFFTLKENAGKRWGEAQFKDKKRIK